MQKETLPASTHSSHKARSATTTVGAASSRSPSSSSSSAELQELCRKNATSLDTAARLSHILSTYVLWHFYVYLLVIDFSTLFCVYFTFSYFFKVNVWKFRPFVVLQSAGGHFRFLVPPSGTTCLSTSYLRRHSRFSDNDSRPFCFSVPTKTLSCDSCVTITIHHYCLDTCGPCNN